MPLFCYVVGCAMRGERDNVRFFRFPGIITHRGDALNALSLQRRERWVRALRRGELNETMLRNGRICSRHFISGTPANLEDESNPDWVPSVHMGYVTSKKCAEAAAARYERNAKRSKQLHLVTPSQVTETVEAEAVIKEEMAVAIGGETLLRNARTVSSQTDLTMKDVTDLYDGLNNANSRIYSLESQYYDMDVTTEDSFKNNDAKTRYFTGLPNSGVLFIIYNAVSSYLSSHSNCALSTFKQLLLTLMKLRLNLPFKYLACKFGISPFTASEYFYKTIDVLYDRFKSLIFWPDREMLQKNVPACFREAFGTRVTVIIDCFEIFTETPSHLLRAAQSWSHYKHHQTVKFLIGITPQGSISFISEAWGGRTSDKYLTENSGFLNLILPNDLVLADRGFLIKESLRNLGADLKIPAFTKGRNQLHPVDLENTRSIAAVRIHVERVIGLLKKKFMILRGPIPISMLSKKRGPKSAIDKISVVCSALVNICPSQIPMD